MTALPSDQSLDDVAFTSDVRLKYMPRSVKDSWNPRNTALLASNTPADYNVQRALFRRSMEIVGAMHRAGVKIIAGTDVLNPFVFPGFSFHDELGLLVEAGLTPMDAIRAATVNPAAYQSRHDRTREAGRSGDARRKSA